MPLAVQPAALSDDRAEIMAHVIDPCYLEMARRESIAGLTHEQAAELAKALSPDEVEIAVTIVQDFLTPGQDPAMRGAMLAMALQVCLNAL